jgi:hypothetical protein
MRNGPLGSFVNTKAAYTTLMATLLRVIDHQPRLEDIKMTLVRVCAASCSLPRTLLFRSLRGCFDWLEDYAHAHSRRFGETLQRGKARLG